MYGQKAKYTDRLHEHLERHSKVYKKDGEMEKAFYEEESLKLQHELVKLQKWIIESGKRLLILFEGIDTAGKTTTIKEMNRYMNPREARDVALSKPSSKELGQWYFQRHIEQMPNAGEIVFFDRSWYNRAGIEQVFGFCTQSQHDHFYQQVNGVEEMLVDDGILFFKFYLNITKKTQGIRLKEREENPLKNWKLSDLDYKSYEKYDIYQRLKEKMFRLSGTPLAPWCEIDANDKKRAKLNAVRYLLSNIDYDKRDYDVIRGVDQNIVTLHS